MVLSSLAIHYLPSFTDFLERVRQCLSPGGDFVFSVEHPIFTAAGPQEWYYGPDGTPSTSLWTGISRRDGAPPAFWGRM